MSFTSTTSIQGTITDASTQAPLSGVAIQITGLSDTIYTDSQGAYAVTQLTPGEVILQATLDGYLTASSSLTLTAGTSHIVSLTLSPDQAILEGIVSDSNGVLVGANIYIDGTLLTQTDTDGSYRIEGLASGIHHISIELDGYDSLASSVTIPSNTIVTLSPQLYPTGTTPPTTDNASVTGKVIDKATQLPLPGVTVTNGTQTTTTDSTGQFNLTNLAAGENILSLSLTGYLNKTITVNLSPFSQLALGEIFLMPEGYKTPVGIKGIVMDASTNQTLANVNIEAQFDQTLQQLTTAPDGSFEITTEVDELNAQLTFSIEGYAPYTLDIQLIADEIIDLGQIRLRPEEVTALLADLVIEQLDKTATQTDPQSLVVSGSIAAQIKNVGTVDTGGNTSLLAFYDVDLNGIYDENDLSLGQATLENPLAVEETATVDISLAGELPFRDAPIHVWVDNTQAVVESDEENNIRTTTSLCEMVPDIGTFEPVLKWGVRSSSGYVTMTPMVAPLIDTNGDDQINELDEPAIVFIGAFGWPDGKPGILIAVSGVDGRELWRLNSHLVRATSQIAIADIDGDKIPEIIANSYHKGTIAVNNDGTVKWISSYPDYSTAGYYGGYSVADLDGDGQAEIVIDKTVLDANGDERWKGSSSYFGYQLSVIADINLDGKPEVVVGPSAYDADGNLLWENSSLNDGAVAIANFNEDPFPEIILVGGGSVHMLNHQGEIIWGPVIVAPRAGGAPTIADADGDGILDIGVAGRNQYFVINSDGSIKWSSYIEDGSEQTGSIFFDFDGNGEVEIVYCDMRRLRVFNGKTGEVIFAIYNSSVTAKEYPVIADVDNDNHADLVVPSFANQYGIPFGIRVFQDVNNSWVRTRNIWNQYSYHITNINDDLSVPRVEPNSWEVHNTYRLNTIPGESVTGTPDLTVGKLRLIDNGIAQPLTLSVRIGNAGAQTSEAGISLSFYSNTTELGTLTLPAIAPGTYQDFQLEGIALAELNQEISAVVEALSECDENNNSVSTTISSSTISGEI
ncbi:MAG: carboxypeptidase-like regulatory domain-containing protein, partial [Pseudomonadota bacterium]